jgi:hypothetical protein
MQAARTVPLFVRRTPYLFNYSFENAKFGACTVEVWRSGPGDLWGYAVMLDGDSCPIDAKSCRYRDLLDALCRGYDELARYVEVPPWEQHARWVRRVLRAQHSCITG